MSESNMWFERLEVRRKALRRVPQRRIITLIHECVDSGRTAAAQPAGHEHFF